MTLRASFRAAFSIPVAIVWFGIGAVSAQDQVKRTELLRTDVTGIEGREAVAYIAEIVPGGVAPKHTHPGDEVVYVLEGTLIFEPEGKETITLKQGEVTHLPAGLVHLAKNGSDKDAVRALVVSGLGKGKTPDDASAIKKSRCLICCQAQNGSMPQHVAASNAARF